MTNILLQGKRQSANVLFVPKNLETIEDNEDKESKFTKHLYLQVQNKKNHNCYKKYLNLLTHFQNQKKNSAMTGGASLFDRPGMGGSIAFRNTLFSFEKEGLEGSIGSAGSLVNEDDDDEVQIELPPFNEADFAPVAIFLTGLGTEYKKGQKALVCH